MTSPEIFRDIPNFEYYKISNRGRIIAKEVDRKWRNKDSSTFFKERELLFSTDKDGYLKTALRNAEGDRFYFRVHRLVCLTFLENPNNYPVVNHKDGVKNNNNLDNLEWCSISQNTKHGFDVLNRKIDATKLSKKIWLFDLNFNLISEFNTYKGLAEYIGTDVTRVHSYLNREKSLGVKATLLKKYRAKIQL